MPAPPVLENMPPSLGVPAALLLPAPAVPPLAPGAPVGPLAALPLEVPASPVRFVTDDGEQPAPALSSAKHTNPQRREHFDIG